MGIDAFFSQAGCPSCYPTNIINALPETTHKNLYRQ